MRYREYIDSPTWKAKRATYFACHPKVCAACGGKKAIALHHLSYERLGRELDSDLIPMCEQCHRLTHAYQRAHRCSLSEATAAIIVTFRGARRATAKRSPPSPAFKPARPFSRPPSRKKKVPKRPSKNGAKRLRKAIRIHGDRPEPKS